MKKCWEESCLNNPTLIPAFRIKVEDSLGRTYTKVLNTLNCNKEYSTSQLGNEDVPDSSFILNPELSKASLPPNCVSTLDETPITHSLCYEENTQNFNKDHSSSQLIGNDVPESSVINPELTEICPTTNCVSTPDQTPIPHSMSYEEEVQESCNIDFVTSTPKVSRKHVKENKVSHKDTDSDHNQQDNIIQVKLVEPSSSIDGNEQDKTLMRLIHVFGKSELLVKYVSSKRKVQMYPNDTMYWDEYRNVCAKLEVMVTLENERLRQEIKDIQVRRLKNNYISLSLLPSEGSEKLRVDEIIRKLKVIVLLRKAFSI